VNKAWKSWKLYMQFLGNKQYEKKLKEKATIQVEQEVN
jgi:hypothetical protein